MRVNYMVSSWSVITKSGHKNGLLISNVSASSNLTVDLAGSIGSVTIGLCLAELLENLSTLHSHIHHWLCAPP